MSTDKTLADVQPSNRVTLGDSLPPLPPEVDSVRCMIRGEKDLAESCDYYYTAEQMREYARAALALQQVAQEPVAYIAKCELDSLRDLPVSFKCRPTVWAKPTGQAGIPLYAAPTAQAVDLGQFRALAAFGEEFAFSAEKQPYSRVIYAQARRLLALIDSHAGK